jgi:hypothetical protein
MSEDEATKPSQSDAEPAGAVDVVKFIEVVTESLRRDIQMLEKAVHALLRERMKHTRKENPDYSTIRWLYEHYLSKTNPNRRG